MYYDIIKSLHLVAVISWMVGLLYLPRLFVYHNDKKHLSDTDTTFLLMEYRLLKYIMNPALILTYVFGIILIYLNGLEVLFLLWIQVKLVLVVILSVYHEYLGKCLKSLKDGTNKKTSKFFRIINEVPTILLIIIVFIVVFKPL